MVTKFWKIPNRFSGVQGCVWHVACIQGLRFAKSRPKQIDAIGVFAKNVKIMIPSCLVIHFGVRLLSGAKYMVDPLPGCVTGNICKLPNDTSNIGNVTRIIVGDTFL